LLAGFSIIDFDLEEQSAVFQFPLRVMGETASAADLSAVITERVPGVINYLDYRNLRHGACPLFRPSTFPIACDWHASGKANRRR
jgi:hypothetical protein